MKICLFIFVMSLVSLAQSRGVKVDIARMPAGLAVENGNTFSWQTCTSANSVAVINALDITLNGYMVLVDVDVSLGEEVSGGTVSVTVAYSGISIYNQDLSLCDLVEQTGNSCPIPKDEYKHSAEFQIPSSIPYGTYTGDVSVADQNGDSLGCIEFEMYLSRY